MTPEEVARLGGSANSPAQQAARAKNALRAGRAGRICGHCGKPVQSSKLAAHDGCGLWAWLTPAERRKRRRARLSPQARRP